MLAEPTPTSLHDPAFYAALSAALVSIAQAIASHIKGRNGKRDNRSQLTRIETTLTEFTGEQRATNELLAKQITEVDHIVRGVEKTNGMRRDVRELIDEMDELKRRGHFNTPTEVRRVDPRDVGTYQAPKSA